MHVRRAVLHVGIANTFPAFPAHAQPAILRIWQHNGSPSRRSISMFTWGGRIGVPRQCFWKGMTMDLIRSASSGTGMDEFGNACLHGNAWRRHEMEAFSELLALCAGNSPVTGEFPAQRTSNSDFDVSLMWVWIKCSTSSQWQVIWDHVTFMWRHHNLLRTIWAPVGMLWLRGQSQVIQIKICA